MPKRVLDEYEVVVRYEEFTEKVSIDADRWHEGDGWVHFMKADRTVRSIRSECVLAITDLHGVEVDEQVIYTNYTTEVRDTVGSTITGR